MYIEGSLISNFFSLDYGKRSTFRKNLNFSVDYALYI